MASLKEEAQAYEPKLTKNIADLPEVSVNIELEDDEFETTDNRTGKPKTVKQKVTIINDERYRVPNSVIAQLKVLLEDNPNLQKFKVKQTGQGLNTDYTVIPIQKV